jgi:hypothetical protein
MVLGWWERARSTADTEPSPGLVHVMIRNRQAHSLHACGYWGMEALQTTAMAMAMAMVNARVERWQTAHTHMQGLREMARRRRLRCLPARNDSVLEKLKKCMG